MSLPSGARAITVSTVTSSRPMIWSIHSPLNTPGSPQSKPSSSRNRTVSSRSSTTRPMWTKSVTPGRVRGRRSLRPGISSLRSRRPRAHPPRRQTIGRGRPAHRGRSRATIGSHRLRVRASGRRCARRPLPDHQCHRPPEAQPRSSPKPRGTRARNAVRPQSLGSCRRQAPSESPGPTRSPDPRNDRERHRSDALRTLVRNPRSQAPHRVGEPGRCSPVTPPDQCLASLRQPTPVLHGPGGVAWRQTVKESSRRRARGMSEANDEVCRQPRRRRPPPAPMSALTSQRSIEARVPGVSAGSIASSAPSAADMSSAVSKSWTTTAVRWSGSWRIWMPLAGMSTGGPSLASTSFKRPAR